MATILSSRLSIVLLIICAVSEHSFSNELDDASIVVKTLNVNDVAYDSQRDILYASTDDSGGSIFKIDPLTLNVVDQFQVGDQANRIKITKDSQRLFIGIDQKTGFRHWDIASNQLSPIRPLNDTMGYTYRVVDFAVWPSSNDVVAISLDQVESTSSGQIHVFNKGSSILFGNTEFRTIGFVDSKTLISERVDIRRWEFSGNQLVFQKRVHDLGSRNIKIGGTRIYGNNGRVFNSTNLWPEGTFCDVPADAAFEPLPNQTTYFFADRKLQLFESKKFLRIGEKTFDKSVPKEVHRLIWAGPNRLAFLGQGVIGVISNVPTQ